MREYEEIVTQAPAKNLMSARGDAIGKMGFDHAGLSDLPPDHPDISGLPPDHPDISGMGLEPAGLPAGMQLPAGQNTPETQRALDASVARPPLSWQTPKGWLERKGSGMRLATFSAQDQNNAIECSIVSLGGQAGGFESNVIRWMKQINVNVPSDGQFKEFLSRQSTIKSTGNFPLTVIDLTELTEGEKTPSMIAAIAELPDMTIFVKMTGSKEALAENRDRFSELCESLNIN
jgi:hypothetical protein